MSIFDASDDDPYRTLFMIACLCDDPGDRRALVVDFQTTFAQLPDLPPDDASLVDLFDRIARVPEMIESQRVPSPWDPVRMLEFGKKI